MVGDRLNHRQGLGILGITEVVASATSSRVCSKALVASGIPAASTAILDSGIGTPKGWGGSR